MIRAMGEAPLRHGFAGEVEEDRAQKASPLRK
jgi:hypothetical protein